MMHRGMMHGGVVGRGMMDGGLVGSGMVGSGLMVGGLALVLDIHHVARVGIGGVVVHNLGAAVGEEDAVVASGGVAVALLISTKLHIVAIAVLGIDTVLVGIVGGTVLVLGLMVAASMVGSRGMMDRGVVDGGMVDRGMVHRGVVRHSVVSDGHSGEGSNEDEGLHIH